MRAVRVTVENQLPLSRRRGVGRPLPAGVSVASLCENADLHGEDARRPGDEAVRHTSEQVGRRRRALGIRQDSISRLCIEEREAFDGQAVAGETCVSTREEMALCSTMFGPAPA
jgi:hypothetical protein